MLLEPVSITLLNSTFFALLPGANAPFDPLIDVDI